MMSNTDPTNKPLVNGPCLIYVICVCMRIVVSNTYCVVFLFCYSWSDAPYVASFLGSFRFLIAPSVFSNVYIYIIRYSNYLLNL
jgi:hypothetical protein